jgi:UDP-glucose:tetrahydrobiopterin glucosyltransferase
VRRLSVLVVSTPIGPIGSGIGGGVELTARNLVDGLVARGHHVEVVAPSGSFELGHATHGVAGTLQPSSQHQPRGYVPVLPPDSVLENMWALVARLQDHFDIVINLAYDVLPFERARTLDVTVAHLVSMGSLSDAMDAVILRTLTDAPATVAMHSRAQAATFDGGESATIVGGGVRISDYRFTSQADSDGHLGFVGRIAPEKGLADAVHVAALSGRPLVVWGLMQDEACWSDALAQHPSASVAYGGFLDTADLQVALGGCSGILVTPKWEEAFGNIVIEALACGVPVVAYDRGGPAEIVAHGRTGFVIPPDDPLAMAEAVARLGEISRQECRAEAESRYSVEAFAERLEAWLARAIQPVSKTRCAPYH